MEYGVERGEWRAWRFGLGESVRESKTDEAVRRNHFTCFGQVAE